MGYWLDSCGIAVCFLAGTRDFLFSRMSRLDVGTTQHPVQWISGTLSQALYD